MHTKPAPQNPPGADEQDQRPRYLLVVIALALFALAAIGPAQSAQANEFVPKPNAAYLPQCWYVADSPNALRVQLTLTNEGLGSAHFTVVAVIDGVTTTDTFDVGPVPVVVIYWVPEDKVSSFDTTSSDDANFKRFQALGPVDCNSDPTATLTVECPAESDGQAELTYTYFNPSHMSATFGFTSPNGPDISFAASDMDDPVTFTEAVDEGAHVVAEVTADDVVIASIDTIVDCVAPIHTVTVTKEVIDAPGDPSFDFELVCGPDSPSTVTSTFSLHDGESQQLDLPTDGLCIVAEIAPGAMWETASTLDGGTDTDGVESVTFDSTADHTVDFVNTYVPHHVLTVGKVATGGTAGQQFDFELDCLLTAGGHEVTPFDLASGETQDLPLFGTVGCTVTELDPGTGWTTTHALDAGAMAPGRSQAIDSGDDHHVLFANVKATPTDRETTTTLPEEPTTVPEMPQPTVPTTETIPLEDSTPDSPTTTETPSTTPQATETTLAVEPNVLAQESVPVTQEEVVAARGLARTGSSTASLAVLAVVLLGSGTALVLVQRRRLG